MHCPPRHWPSSRLSPLDPFGLIQDPLPCYPLRKEVFLWVPTPRPEASGPGLAVSQVSLAHLNTLQIW